MTFWEKIVAGFKAALPTIEKDAALAGAAVKEFAPVVSKFVPGAAPFIAEGQAVINTVTGLAPGATQSAHSALAEIEQIIAAGSAEVKRLGELFASIGHVQQVGQNVTIVPKTTGATMPAVLSANASGSAGPSAATQAAAKPTS